MSKSAIKGAPHAHDVSLMERALTESYDLGAELPAEARVQHLISLCSGAAEVDSLNAKEREWIEELFRLSDEMASSDRLRLNAQATAVRLMAPLNLKRALQMFDALEPPARPDFDSRQWVARELFAKMLEQQGVKSIPLLRARARKLGESGAYPYAAMVPVLTKLKDQPEKASQVFAEALTYYRQGKDPGSSNMNFVSFLSGAHALKIIPEWLMHEAALELSARVMSDLESSKDATAPGDSYRQLSRFHVVYSVLQSIDAEVAKNMQAQEPSGTSSLMSDDSMAVQAEDQWNRSHNAAKYNGDAEYQQLRGRTDDLIRNIMEMSEDGKQGSPDMQAAISMAIASGVKATQRKMDVDPANADTYRRNAPELASVVDAASKIAPVMTLREIESVSDTELRAYLLILFAGGIRELQFMREMESTDVARPVVVERK